MKKLLLTNLFAICAGSFLMAQHHKSVTPEQYNQLKASRQLMKGVNYNFIDAKSITNNSKFVPSIHQTDTSGASTCSCIVPLDSTFSLVPMVGYTPPYRNDDSYSSAIPLPFNLQVFGNSYDSIIINNNGNISFDSQYSAFTANNFPDPTFKMIAPFWADVDTRDAASGLVYYKIMPHYMIVKWDHVGYYNIHSDKLNTFQLIVSDGTDSIIPNGNNIAFCYGDMQWTTGDASSGVNGFGGVASTVGVNNGDGINFSQLTRNDSTGITYDGPNGNSDGIDWLDYRSFYFNTAGTMGVAPIAYDSLCDSLVPVFDSLGSPFRVFLNSMNANDSITFTIQSLPSGMHVVPTNQGNTTQLAITFNPTIIGSQVLSIDYSNQRLAGITHNYHKVFDVQSIAAPTGLTKNTSESKTGIYPNPAKNIVSFQFNTNESYTAKIVDALGRTVGNYHSISNASNTIEVGMLTKGVYTVIIENGAKTQEIKKLIID